MLKRIKIENLRGIREGELDGLTKLVVLVGPNGSGKSTVLEGAFIAGSQQPAMAAGTVTRRRVHTKNGASWLIHGANEKTSALTEVEWSDGICITRRVRWDSRLFVPEAKRWFSEANAPPPWTAFRIYRDRPPMPKSEDGAEVFSATAMAGDNEFFPMESETDLQPPPLRFADPRAGLPLHDLFTQAIKVGRREDIMAIATMVVPDLEGIEILTEDGAPRLCFTFHTGPAFVVPVSLAGDGVHALLRMVFELASPAGGTVLLEEPEVHMHPRALYACAKAIVAATRRDVQVILTTHSLDLIDLLLSELSEGEIVDPSMMTLRRVKLLDGKLVVAALDARDADQIRTGLHEDLR